MWFGFEHTETRLCGLSLHVVQLAKDAGALGLARGETGSLNNIHTTRIHTTNGSVKVPGSLKKMIFIQYRGKCKNVNFVIWGKLKMKMSSLNALEKEL